MELMTAITQIPGTLVPLFIFCEMGERVTHEFNVFYEKLCDCHWYAFPIELQQMFLISLSGTQEPAVVQGFVNTTCTRDTFKQVISYENFDRNGKDIELIYRLRIIKF